MASQYTIEIHDDGTFISSPATPMIVPGTGVLFTINVKTVQGNSFGIVDLTNCNLVCAVLNSNGIVRIYQTGPPAVVITSPTKGRFTLSLSSQLTQVLASAEEHYLEIKSIRTDGERRQLCLLPLVIGSTALRGE